MLARVQFHGLMQGETSVANRKTESHATLMNRYAVPRRFANAGAS